jgi:hypothetical protein
MKLTPHDISSALWQKLYDHYTPLLAKARARAENIEISNEERMKLLYQIKFIKEFLALSELDNKKTTRED